MLIILTTNNGTFWAELEDYKGKNVISHIGWVCPICGSFNGELDFFNVRALYGKKPFLGTKLAKAVDLFLEHIDTPDNNCGNCPYVFSNQNDKKDQ